MKAVSVCSEMLMHVREWANRSSAASLFDTQNQSPPVTQVQGICYILLDNTLALGLCWPRLQTGNNHSPGATLAHLYTR